MIQVALRACLAVLVVACTAVFAEPEIYRCAQEDGTIAFQQTPCIDADPVAPSDADAGREADTANGGDFFGFTNPFENSSDKMSEAPTGTPDGRSDDKLQEQPETQTEEEAGNMTQDREECEKTTRNAIDAIDVELQQSNGSGEDRARLADLLKLTRRLRQCKQL